MDEPEITITLREFAEYFVKGTSPDTEPIEEFDRPAWTNDTLAGAEETAIRLARQYRGEGFEIYGRDRREGRGPSPWELVEIIECAAPTESDFDCFSEDYLLSMLPKGWTYDCGMTGFWIIGPNRDERLYIPLRFLAPPPVRGQGQYVDPGAGDDGHDVGWNTAGEGGDASDAMGEPRTIGGPHEIREQYRSEPRASRRDRP